MHHPLFWRDPALPHVELRVVSDGRQACYAPHSHAEWSIGAITDGESLFLRDDQASKVQAGCLVFVNPHQVHACNPVEGQPWGYQMLYLDAGWLGTLRQALGLAASSRWQDLAPDMLRAPEHFQAFLALADGLRDPARSCQTKDQQLRAFLSALLPRLAAAPARPDLPASLHALADYLDRHCTEQPSLDALCQQAAMSPGHLIRSFKRYFTMTPHAYLINRRVQRGQQALRQGLPIAQAALEGGFADQPHFQRQFKRLLAATPRQYRQGLTR